MLKKKFNRIFSSFTYTRSEIKSQPLPKSNLNSLYEKYKEFTMIPQEVFVENLKLCQEFKDQNGCIVECGVWRGGMSAAMSELLGNTHNYYLFDSFEGLPDAKEIDGRSAIRWQNDKESTNYHDNCKAEINFAKQALSLANCHNYEIIKGWFSDTLPDFSSEKEIAILRLDGDWYESTMDCLTYLYPKVKQGGLIIIDDYYAWDGCSRAVHDYLSMIKSPHKIRQKNDKLCYIIKSDRE